MKKNTYMILALTFIITSCATSAKYTAQLNREIGKSSNELISSYGRPTRVRHLSNGDEIITYISINTEIIPAPNFYFNTDFMTEDEMFYPFTYNGDAIPIDNYMGDVVEDYCKTEFYLKNNIVTSWQYSGNSCVAL